MSLPEAAWIGVLSDTHDHLDPRLPALLTGAHRLLHAGDIGRPRILQELERLAPVTAVAGNTDDPTLARETEVVEWAGRRFLVRHIVDPHQPDAALTARLERDRPDAVIFGHTHRPFCEVIGGVLFLNPGYAGRPRLGQRRSLVRLRCSAAGLEPEFLDLD